MNKLKLWGFATMAAALMLTACGDDTFSGDEQGEGRLALEVDLDTQIVSNTTITSRAEDGGVEAEDVKVQDLNLLITSLAENRTLLIPISEFDASTAFPAGAYKIEVEYGDKSLEGFGHPYYYGCADGDIIISKGETTPVKVKAELANSMFTVVYGDNLKSYFTKYEASLKSETGAEAIVYAPEATRRVYMHAGEQVTVNLSFTKPNGTSATVIATKKVTEPKKHYRVTLDVTGLPTTTEGAALTVAFDDDLEDGGTTTIDLDDAALTAAAPTIKTEGFANGDQIEFYEGAAYGEDLKFAIFAPGKLASVKIDTENADLINGWSSPMELIGMSEADQAKAKAAGLQALGVWKNPDQMAIVNLKDVIQNIRLLSSTPQTVKFTVSATDMNTNSVSNSVSFLISKFVVSLSIANPSPAILEFGATALDLDLTYNGPSIKDNVVIKYRDDWGNYNDCEVAYTEKGNDAYVAHLTELPTSGDVNLSAFYTAADGTVTQSNEITVAHKYPNIAITGSENDVWATKASFVVKNANGTSCLADAFTAAVYLQKAGATEWVLANSEMNETPNIDIDGDDVHLWNLAPNTTYTAKVSLSGKAAEMSDASYTFTTEAAAQVDNYGMESWCQTSSGKNWELVWPGASQDACVWGTNNPLTTSQGSDYAYCRISGTISTTDRHGGNTAALIRTVGWGSGNSATGSGGGSGKTKYVDAGLLHLGASRSVRPSGYSSTQGALTTDDLNCGIAFASRPESLSFWYKYSPKNSADNGYAEVQVIAADGTVIASNTVNLGSKDAYTQITLPLEYGANAPKAAKIYVKFLSTNDRQFLEKSDANLSGPGFANLGRGTFMGSQLYIDDIMLNY